MSRGKWDDLYERLTSRKLWLTLMSVGFALWNYTEGRLSPLEFQIAVAGAFGLYVGAEAATDVAWNLRARPDQTDRSVNVEVQQPPAPPPPPVEAPPTLSLEDRVARVERAINRA